jgi:[ribosomal protein S18]-alanine N-acetyltransferase
MITPVIECRAVSPEWANALADFFRALIEAGDEKFFHPHPLNSAEARKLAHYHGNDLYYLLTEGNRVCAYGILRGWDEGYEIPSLGIVVHPRDRGSGLGTTLMHFMHVAARRRGAKKIRLKAYPENSAALKFYQSLGYRFDSDEDGQLVGVLAL